MARQLFPAIYGSSDGRAPVQLLPFCSMTCLRQAQVDYPQYYVMERNGLPWLIKHSGMDWCHWCGERLEDKQK